LLINTQSIDATFKNVELVVDGNEYTSTYNGDKELQNTFDNIIKQDYESDKQKLDAKIAELNSQQQNKFNAMNNYSGNYNTNAIGDPSTKRIADTIKEKESNNNYGAKANGSTASGAYQFTNGTWNSLTKKYGIGTQYKTASSAPPAIQDAIAGKYIEDIMKDVGGDVTKVPVVWYTGNKYGQMSSDAIAANNGLTPQVYQQKWLNIYNTKA
jgi:muramidase (phage lysozyme)